uniref:Ig-like domain-containing protein n=1 Tax=Astyanax mexicanus TaxID=7994 RepID=A0A8B9R8X2_ASTMX
MHPECPVHVNCFKLVGAGAHLFAVAGETLILPCSIQPNTSAVDMRVEWFRLDVVDSLVHLYKDQSDRNEGQILNYRGRTELFREELQKGNTSLRLSDVRVSDEGAYKCLVEANSWYDDITVNVTVKGKTEPVITMEGYDKSGGISLVCESRGWKPEPEVLWLNREGVSLTAEDTETHRDTEGFTVRSRITVYNSDRIHCRLQQKHHLREAEIIISVVYFIICFITESVARDFKYISPFGPQQKEFGHPWSKQSLLGSITSRTLWSR